MPLFRKGPRDRKPNGAQSQALVVQAAPPPAAHAHAQANDRSAEFATRQSRRDYPETFDASLTAAGEAQIAAFPRVPPQGVPDAIAIKPDKHNHVCMHLGYVQHNLRAGVGKGDTANCYGDAFCQLHGITRVFVVDKANHVIAMCTPHRYMAYMANQTYLPQSARFNGSIFLFGGAATVTPRWAMRAAARNILTGQSGEILRNGDSLSITGSAMVEGVPQPIQVLVDAVPYAGCSWVVMDKWMEDAKDHKISIVAADTGLTELVGRFDKSKTLPLVIREDEADVFMSDPVHKLVVRDDRFHKLRKAGQINDYTKALQFRGGWYAPFHPSGITRIQRILKFNGDPNGPKAEDGSGPWLEPEDAYSKAFIRPASKDLWLIGGVDNIHEEAEAKMLGTHLEMEVRLAAGSGGLNTFKEDV